jgi:hypothetical protein
MTLICGENLALSIGILRPVDIEIRLSRFPARPEFFNPSNIRLKLDRKTTPRVKGGLAARQGEASTGSE